jgi:hypothetical protein
MIVVKIKVRTCFTSPLSHTRCSLCKTKNSTMYRVTPKVFVNSCSKSVIMCKRCVDKSGILINNLINL